MKIMKNRKEMRQELFGREVRKPMLVTATKAKQVKDLWTISKISASIKAVDTNLIERFASVSDVSSRHRIPSENCWNTGFFILLSNLHYQLIESLYG